jgi:hypothetical protein
MAQPPTNPPIVHPRHQFESLWDRLGLGVEEVAALKEQGFVRGEVRGQGLVVYKLRFRLAGRQRVKFLGRDAAYAAWVTRELAILQQPRTRDRRLKQLTRDAGRKLRQSKELIAPLIEQAGFQFHGFAIRRPRSSRHA